MGANAAAWAYASMAATAAYTASEQKGANSRASANANIARENAQKAESQATRDTNKANAKVPDVNALMAANLAGSKGGAGSTLLTGPQGIDPAKMMLGKKTLLGG